MQNQWTRIDSVYTIMDLLEDQDFMASMAAIAAIGMVIKDLIKDAPTYSLDDLEKMFGDENEKEKEANE